jgi:hypothetical protein
MVERSGATADRPRLLCLTASALGGAALALAGCQTVGPMALESGRPTYNQVIHQISAEQALLNLIRVEFQETPLFMDVSEVDAQLTLNAQLVGGQSAIGSKSGNGAAGAVSGTSTSGAVNATLQYEEQPTIRYVPLAGEALIQQISTPITVDSIANLYDSRWPFTALIDLVTDRVTLNSKDNYAATSIIAALNRYEALALVAGKSQLTSKKGGSPTNNPSVQIVAQRGSQPPSQTPNDTLFLFLTPDRVSAALVADTLYYDAKKPLPPSHPDKVVTSGSGVDVTISDNHQPDDITCGAPPTLSQEQKEFIAQRNVLYLWIELLAIYAGTQPAEPDGGTVASGTTNSGQRARRQVDAAPPAPPNAAAAPAKPPVDKASPPAQSAAAPSRPSAHTSIRKQVKYPGTKEIAGFLSRLTGIDTQNLTDRQKLAALAAIAAELPLSIELRTAPIDPSWMADGNFTNRAPVMRTRSALGILKAITAVQQQVEFLPPNDAEQIRGEVRNEFDLNYDFYTLNGDNGDKTGVNNWARHTNCFLYVRHLMPDLVDGRPTLGSLDDEKKLYELRRYILIEKTPERPASAFVAVQGPDGDWYSINEHDQISKENFALINELLTIQAIPTPTAPLTPSLSVGGRS